VDLVSLRYHAAMIVKRIVTNIATADVSKARHFYKDVLGLEIVMDQGWIATFAAPTKMSPQVSVAVEGGSGTPVLISRSRLMIWTKHFDG
jgi:catechol 2,3-dioxygenase-like lactoylglutathione lyase family enzyme